MHRIRDNKLTHTQTGNSNLPHRIHIQIYILIQRIHYNSNTTSDKPHTHPLTHNYTQSLNYTSRQIYLPHHSHSHPLRDPTASAPHPCFRILQPSEAQFGHPIPAIIHVHGQQSVTSTYHIDLHSSTTSLTRNHSFQIPYHASHT